MLVNVGRFSSIKYYINWFDCQHVLIKHMFRIRIVLVKLSSVFNFCVGDLNASEMMMPEDERIQLMILVKEGKLSIDEALEMVMNSVAELLI